MCTTRICNTCKKEKLATSEFFYKDKNKPLGLMYRCKECNIARGNSFTHKEMLVIGKTIKKIKDGRSI